MIPLADRNYRRSIPVVTWGLILANVGVFIYELTLGQQALARLFYDYAAIPCAITGLEGRGCPRLPGMLTPSWLTLFTSMFLHDGFLHIGGNMLFLWVFGDNIEDGMGHLKFLLFYFVCGVAAGWAQLLVDPAATAPGLGASGAIAGVLAAYLLLYPGQPVRTLLFVFIIPFFLELPAFLLIVYWFAIQFVNGLNVLTIEQEGGVAYWAHIGGFAAGLLLARVFAPRRPPPRRYRRGAAWGR